MKHSIFVILLICLFACDGSTTSNQQKKPPTPKPKKVKVKERKIVKVSPSEQKRYLEFCKKQIAEAFFDRLSRPHEVSPVVQESLEIRGDSLSYMSLSVPEYLTLQVIDSGRYFIYSKSSFRTAKEANTTHTFNSTMVKGVITVENIVDDKLIEVKFRGQWRMTIIRTTELYGFPYEEKDFRDSEEITVNVSIANSKKYDRDNLYLKAQLFELTEEDLAGYSKEELGYLRNEIFARHGHVFKTAKMKKYFNDQDWYQPLVYDASELLNEKEQYNILLIKELEAK